MIYCAVRTVPAGKFNLPVQKFYTFEVHRFAPFRLNQFNTVYSIKGILSNRYCIKLR